MSTGERAIWPLRSDAETVRATLELLDRQRQDAAQVSRRGCRRYPYRARPVHLELLGPDGEPAHYLVAARNIGRSGLGLLIGRFVYPGTACRVHLPSRQYLIAPLNGVVRHCHYVSGSPNLYVVGVQFDEPLAAHMFRARN